MGKISFSFSTFAFNTLASGTPWLKPNGAVCFKAIRQVIDALPGYTYIDRIDRPIFGRPNTMVVEAYNDNFLDGTEIVPKYKSVHQVTPWGGQFIDTFDGIDIIDPPAQQASQNGANVQNNAGQAAVINTTTGSISITLPNVTATPVTQVTSVVKSNQTAGVVNLNYLGDQIDPYGIDWSGMLNSMKPKCTCGADSVGGAHSGYCDKK